MEGMSNFGMAETHKSNASIARSNARVARAQGIASKGKAYGQALRLEQENEVAGDVANENMARLRKEQRQAGAQARVARAASGFTDEGSGGQLEVSVLQAYEQTAQDMAQSRSMEDLSARFNATMLRRSGDLAMQSAETEAVYNEDQARVHMMYAHNAKKAALVSAGAQAAGAIVGFASGGPQGAMMGAKVGAGFGSMYAAGQPGSAESQSKDARNTGAEADFMAILAKGMEWLV